MKLIIIAWYQFYLYSLKYYKNIAQKILFIFFKTAYSEWKTSLDSGMIIQKFSCHGISQSIDSFCK